MTDLHPLVGRLTEAARVGRGGRLTWLGASVGVPAPAPETWVVAVAGHLYGRFYVVGGPVPIAEAPVVGTEGHVFKGELARRTRTRRVPRELAVDHANGSLVHARRGELRIAVPRSALLDPPGGSPGTARVLVPGASFQDALGFLYLRGRRPEPEGAPDIVRVYWNVTPAQALWLTRALPAVLDDADLAWEMKALDDPADYHRADSVVLYLPATAWPAARTAIAGVYARLPGAVAGPVPATTHELAPGLGLAEDPGDGRSFGEHLCTALATGLLAAGPGADRNERASAMAGALQRAGMQPAAPHRRLGSDAAYSLTPARRRRARRRRPRDAGSAAFEIGAELARRAIVWGDRATWLAAPLEEPGMGAGGASAETLDPFLYDGTAGMALFFAALARADGDERWARLAHAAATQAITQVRPEGEPPGAGFHGGAGGLAWALVQTGRLLDSDELIESGVAVACAPRATTTTADEDLIAGLAGDLLAFALLERLAPGRVPAGRIDDAAARLDGDKQPPKARSTGLAHGASGAALALAEAANTRGDDGLARSAAAWCEREAAWFDPERGNWADLRRTRSRAVAPAMTAWCHGAPGIGLARVCGGERLGPERAAEARSAADTTERWLRAALDRPQGDLGLCHGIAGNAWVLTRLDPGADALVEQAVQLVAHEVTAPRSAREVWTRPTRPGLMIGWAGLGLFLLRAAGAADLPDPLAPAGWAGAPAG
ncbi:MAG TPA: lanthionine synthetase LanC family protein [Thermoleophilaceae bacterium]